LRRTTGRGPRGAALTSRCSALTSRCSEGDGGAASLIRAASVLGESAGAGLASERCRGVQRIVENDCCQRRSSGCIDTRDPCRALPRNSAAVAHATARAQNSRPASASRMAFCRRRSARSRSIAGPAWAQTTLPATSAPMPRAAHNCALVSRSISIPRLPSCQFSPVTPPYSHRKTLPTTLGVWLGKERRRDGGHHFSTGDDSQPCSCSGIALSMNRIQSAANWPPPSYPHAGKPRQRATIRERITNP
jgi:hypothetical protein